MKLTLRTKTGVQTLYASDIIIEKQTKGDHYAILLKDITPLITVQKEDANGISGQVHNVCILAQK